jgi:hypothetical protein
VGCRVVLLQVDEYGGKAGLTMRIGSPRKETIRGAGATREEELGVGRNGAVAETGAEGEEKQGVTSVVLCIMTGGRASGMAWGGAGIGRRNILPPVDLRRFLRR